jgi:PAS domain S-box-containing protein
MRRPSETRAAPPPAEKMARADAWYARLLRLLDSPSRQVAIGVGVIAAAVSISFAHDQYQRYEEAIARADRDTRNAAVLLAENTARTFDGIEETLHALAALHHDVAASVYQDRATIHNLMAAIRGGTPVLRDVGIVDADGDVTAMSSSLEPPPLNVGDQEHFIRQRDTATRGIYVAAPVKSSLNGVWVIKVSLRLEDADGRFAGIATGMVDPNYFASVYRSIELGPSRIAALYREDGIVLSREPELEQRLGKSVASASWFRERVPQTMVGTFHGRNLFDGSERIMSFARVPGRGMLVSVSILRAEALAGFQTALLRAAARIGPLLLLLVAGSWVLAVQLRRRHRADRKFRDLLESAPDAMVIVDREGRIALVNAEAEKLFGYGRAELLGQGVETLIPERYREAHPHFLAGFVNAPTRRPIRSGLGLHGRRRDGSEFPLEISLAPLDTEEGILISSAIRDISERKQAETELIESRRQAETANRAKSDFLSRMSHELRTPLNALMGFAQILELNRECSLTPKQRDYVNHILAAGRHLLELVNDVLDLAGVEAGRLKLSIETVSVREVIDHVRRTMRPLAQKASVSFESFVPDGIPDLRADELRLRQVLINLASNAIKYNRPAGAVTLGALPSAGGRVRLVVSDTGIGIPADQHKEVFQPFQRLSPDQAEIEGTGIGLAISRRLVEAMGGAIGFDSQPGVGSTFWIDLPIAATAELPVEAAGAVALDRRALTPSRTPQTRSGGYSLLYVEDNPASLRLLEHLLSGMPGVTMLSAPTPQFGLDLATAHRPDVIVLDLNLPGMSGFEVLARLKAKPETRDIPVLALTAAAFPRDVAAGLAAGFFRYLTKPLDVNAFLAAIDDALAQAASRRAEQRAQPAAPPLEVLVAEDHEVTGIMIAELLAQLGHHVERVGNGRDAVAAVERHSYDVVLMDIEMPQMGGVEATKAIRALAAPARLTPVIGLTAHACGDLNEELSNIGISGCLTKPVQREALAAALARWTPRGDRTAA